MKELGNALLWLLGVFALCVAIITLASSESRLDAAANIAPAQVCLSSCAPLSVLRFVPGKTPVCECRSPL
jgi:hypothetical protein